MKPDVAVLEDEKRALEGQIAKRPRLGMSLSVDNKEVIPAQIKEVIPAQISTSSDSSQGGEDLA